MRLNMHVIHQTFGHHTNWIARSWIYFNLVEYTLMILISLIHFNCTSNRFNESESGIEMNSQPSIYLNPPQSVFFYWEERTSNWFWTPPEYKFKRLFHVQKNLLQWFVCQETHQHLSHSYWLTIICLQFIIKESRSISILSVQCG